MLRLVFVVVVVLSITVLADGELQFAGLSLRTTIDDARRRYPRSMIVGQHVYVSDRDSHDGIQAIDIPDAGSSRRLVVFFEHTTANGNSYPPCDRISQVVRRQYADPATVQEFDEERSRNRRLIWRRGPEEMSLLCFRRATQEYSAAELTISLNTPPR